MMRIFNNICFKSKIFLLIAVVSFLSQVSIAQNNVSEAVTINEMEFSPRGAFNYRFYLISLVTDRLLGEPFDVEKLLGEEMINVAEDVYRPFRDVGVSRQYLHRYSLTPLIYAVVNEDVEAVNSILAQEGVDPDLQDSNDMTPFVWAAIIGNEDIVRALVDAEIDVRFQIDAAISYAEERGNTRIVDYLREML